MPLGSPPDNRAPEHAPAAFARRCTRAGHSTRAATLCKDNITKCQVHHTTGRAESRAGSRAGSLPPVALTIAGSDSGGGAGIQADLKTFHQWGVFGTSALTAVTAQNTVGVQAIHPVPAGTIAAQIRSVADDLPPHAVKSGMLATAEIVHTVAAAIRGHGIGNYVLDPVMVATSGDTLLERDAVAAVRGDLLPQATIVTPQLARGRPPHRRHGGDSARHVEGCARHRGRGRTGRARQGRSPRR